MYILGIDPGNVQSTYVIIDEDLRSIKFEKIDNEELITMVCNGDFNKCKYIAIERLQVMEWPLDKQYLKHAYL